LFDRSTIDNAEDAMRDQHIAVYVRVSTNQQTTKSQEPDLERWLRAYGDDLPVKWYRDRFTGKTMDRPGWRRLETAIHAGAVAKLVVWRLDRLGRTAKGLTSLFNDLVERKLPLVSIKDNVDLSTSAGRMLANVLASVAQYETELRGERVRAGQAAARARGGKWGGSTKGRLLTTTQQQVDTVTKLASEGRPKTYIAKATGLSRPTIYRILENATVAI
jgi:DNA invertase Pin-like site-specific DNA recombinase